MEFRQYQKEIQHGIIILYACDGFLLSDEEDGFGPYPFTYAEGCQRLAGPDLHSEV